MWPFRRQPFKKEHLGKEVRIYLSPTALDIAAGKPYHLLEGIIQSIDTTSATIKQKTIGTQDGVLDNLCDAIHTTNHAGRIILYSQIKKYAFL